MKILHVAYDYDGASASARIAATQVAAGHEVYFYSKRGLHRFGDSSLTAVSLTRLGTLLLNRLDRVLTRLCVERRREGFFSLGRVNWPLATQVKSGKWDQVHIHWIASGFCSLKALLEQVGGRKIVHLHDYWILIGLTSHIAAGRSLNALGRRLQSSTRTRNIAAMARYRPMVMAPSTMGAEFVTEMLAGTAVEVGVFPNPIGPEFASRNGGASGNGDAGKIVMLHVLSGNDPWWKGVDQTIQALRLLPRPVAERIVLHQVGAGVSAVSVVNGCTLRAYPAVPPAAMPGIFAQAHFTIVWSIAETFSQAAAESLSCGVPLITHAGLPCARFCTRPSSLVAPERSPAGLARILAQAVAAGDLRSAASLYVPEPATALAR